MFDELPTGGMTRMTAIVAWPEMAPAPNASSRRIDHTVGHYYPTPWVKMAMIRSCNRTDRILCGYQRRVGRDEAGRRDRGTVGASSWPK